ncbi:Succinate dehydrogenase [ubiquinone] cytochrome b small subunit, mitochondrial, partial [Fragariocoptes setiger]
MNSLLGNSLRLARLSTTTLKPTTFAGRNLTRCTRPLRAASTDGQYHYHKPPSTEHHDKLWAYERYLSLGLLGAIPAAAVIHHPIMDYALALSLVVHVHWGVEAIVTDYIRPSIFGPTIPKLSIALVYILSSLALGGLFMFNYTDIGLSQATRMLARL